MTDETTPKGLNVDSFLNPSPSTDTDFEVPEEADPHVNVVEVRGKLRVSFKGFDQLQLDDEIQDKVFDTYRELLLELYRVVEHYDRPHDAWHIGRVLDEYRVTEDDTPYSVVELDVFNPVGEMYGRRLRFARGIYVFWPEQGYDPSHSVTALGEFSWAAFQAGEEEAAREGYARLRDHGAKLRRMDGRFWKKVEDGSLEEIVEIVTEPASYDSLERAGEAAKRVLLLTNQSIEDVSEERLRDLIQDQLAE